MSNNPVQYQIRQRSAHGQPQSDNPFTRRCKACSACFIGLAPGKTGERGIWCDWRWYCSAECAKGHVPDEYLK